MTTVREARRAARAPMAAAVAAALQAGRLEQTCPDCGRWEAAGSFCSWCGRPMTAADWYPNGTVAERSARRPSARPANPPSEFLSESDWPTAWGTFPRQRAPRQPQTPPKQAPDPVAVSYADGTLGLA